MTQSNAIQGNIKIAADSLDVTPYYDLFVGTNAAAGKQPAASKPAVAAKPAATPSNPDQEPAAMHFPLHNFTVDTTVHYFYLREVEITNFQVTTKIDGGHIVVTPCQLSLNGAPVSASVDVDLGVPGFKYDVSFNAQAVPLPPLVDSFQPERKGQLGGTFTAQTKISGAGITGTNLQKNLAGQFGMSSTNLNLAVGNIKNPMLKLLVNVVSTIPELASNPLGTASSLLGGLTGGTGAGAGTNNSLTTTLSKSPIDTIIANGTIGSGKVNLQQATVRSPAFQADATGTVTLAAILTNSTLQIPVTVSLERSLAQRINMVPANTPTNAIYAQLPAFLTIGGTVGVPKSSIDKVALAKAALQGVTGNVPLKGTAGQAMQGLGSLLGGGSSGSTNSSGTNQTGGLLGGLGGILGGSTGTNAPSATNQPSSTGSVLRGLLGGSTTNAPATNKAPVNNLLNRFLK
jgi:hypothetical protein